MPFKATVDLLELIDAVSKMPKMKRSPAGARGKIAKTTDLIVSTGKMLVVTPVMETEIVATHTIPGAVEVNSYMLIDTLKALSKVDAANDGKVELFGAKGSLSIIGKSITEIMI